MTERARADPSPPFVEWQTSSSHPYAIDWIDLREVSGLHDAAEAGAALGMSFSPGKHHEHFLANHDRDLAADIERIRAVHHVDALLLLVNDGELAAMRIPTLPTDIAAAGIKLLRHPIPDFGVPADRAAFAATIDDVLERLRAGQRVLVACVAGFGRTGTVTAAVLCEVGLAAPEAIAMVRRTRPNTIERDVQVRFVEGWPG